MPFPVEMLRFFEHQSRETGGASDGRVTHRISRSTRRPAAPTGVVIPEPAIPSPAIAPAFSLSGERVGSGGKRIGGRAEVAGERRDDWPTRRDAEESLNG
jgi:hypothetical protein